MMQKTPVRRSRPYAQKLMPVKPMTTGQRIIDTLFPVAKGGTSGRSRPLRLGQDRCAASPLPSGRTSTSSSTSAAVKRGNEMTDVLREFPELIDPAPARP
jgi:V/A-type H+-transporting ATPase subunit A